MPSIRLDCPKTNTVFGEIFYPGLIVQVLLTSGYQPFEFILDSGADMTMVPGFLANLAGVQLPNVPDTSVVGISSRLMPAFKGKLKMRLKTEVFEVRCLFTESNRTPLLLGRLDFFSIFDVGFDGNDCKIILTRRHP
ncbi:MAG: hypothetical protein U9O84_05135 [Chloroflexota bacterium]|nr:hypothetical protein [Chloroflexota bacterium]